MRVGAMLSKSDEKIELIGYGTLVSEEIPEGAVGVLAEMARALLTPNPKIQLDSGQIVWGCECWWGEEEGVKDQVAQHKNVVNVDIDEVRAQWDNDGS